MKTWCSLAAASFWGASFLAAGQRVSNALSTLQSTAYDTRATTLLATRVPRH